MTWRQSFERTWLFRDDAVSALDEWVKRTLANHRGLTGEQLNGVSPWSVLSLVRSVDDFGTNAQWLWCLAAISLLQELIFCAEGGGIDPLGAANDGDLRRDLQALREIRNATFHPAAQIQDGTQQPPMKRLIEILECDDDLDITDVALRLPDTWSCFADLPIARYALRKLGSAGQLFISKQRLLTAPKTVPISQSPI